MDTSSDVQNPHGLDGPEHGSHVPYMDNSPSSSFMSKEQVKDVCAGVRARLQGSRVESMEVYVNGFHRNLKEQMQRKRSSAIPSVTRTRIPSGRSISVRSVVFNSGVR